MKPELEQEIANLRALNLTPKQIARKLGLRVAEVSAVSQIASGRACPGSWQNGYPRSAVGMLGEWWRGRVFL